MAEWRNCTLGDLLQIKHGFAFQGRYFADAGSHILLTPGNFYDEGGFKDKGDKEKWYRGPVPEDYVLSEGDLIVAMTEQAEGLLGSSAIIPRGGVYLHNQRLGLVQLHDESTGDKRFIYYLFNSKPVRQQIRASASGAKIRHTAPSRIESVSVRIPPLAEQRRIAGILSAYDDLIENNQRRIRILEEMARALYREWFVHFRFPGNESVPRVPSPLGPIPQGWEVKPLNNVVENIVDYRGKTPAKLGGKWSDEGVLALSALNVKRGRLVNLEKSKCVDEELYSRWMKKPLRQGDILMTSEAPLGELFILCKQERYCLSQRLFSIRANRQVIAPIILYLNLESEQTQHELQSRVSGATVSGIRQSELRKVPMVVPSPAIQNHGEPILLQLAEQVYTLNAQVQNLRRTRELLLPRLLSGEVRGIFRGIYG